MDKSKTMILWVLVLALSSLWVLISVPRVYSTSENFETWTEAGSNVSKLGQVGVRSNWTTLQRQHQACLYKSGTWNSWECSFDLNVTAVEAGDSTNRDFIRFVGGVSAPNDYGTVATLKGYQIGATDNQFKFWFEERYVGSQKCSFTGPVMAIDTMYYCYFKKAGKEYTVAYYASSEDRATNSSAIWYKAKNSTRNTGYGYFICPQAMDSSVSADGTDHSTGYIENLDFEFEFSESSSTYYFNFDWYDIDNNQVDSQITWELHNASGDIGYTEGAVTLTEDSYTLKSFRHGHLMNSTDIDTSTYGNATWNQTMQCRAHTHVAGGYIFMNNTISSLSVNYQDSQELNFTISGTTPCWLVVDVANTPITFTKDGAPFSNYTYVPGGNEHVHFNVSSLSTFYIKTYQPTGGPSGPTGGPSGGPTGSQFWRLSVFVTYAGEPLHMAYVSIWNTSDWGYTDVFGRKLFKVSTGTHKVEAEHEDYGKRWVTVTVNDHKDVGIDLSLPQQTGWDLTPITEPEDLPKGTIWLLVLPVGVLIAYGVSLALKKPKRKWKYSYLK